MESKKVKNHFIFQTFDCIIKSIIEQSIPKTHNILGYFGDSDVFFIILLYNNTIEHNDIRSLMVYGTYGRIER